MSEDTVDSRIYTVVINDEEQYSIWFDGRALPAGWRAVGMTGTKDECLAYIDREWTDMRPLSLRTWLDEGKAREMTDAAGS
jgi:MbtH protein